MKRPIGTFGIALVVSYLLPLHGACAAQQGESVIVRRNLAFGPIQSRFECVSFPFTQIVDAVGIGLGTNQFAILELRKVDEKLAGKGDTIWRKCYMLASDGPLPTHWMADVVPANGSNSVILAVSDGDAFQCFRVEIHAKPQEAIPQPQVKLDVKALRPVSSVPKVPGQVQLPSLSIRSQLRLTGVQSVNLVRGDGGFVVSVLCKEGAKQEFRFDESKNQWAYPTQLN